MSFVIVRGSARHCRWIDRVWLRVRHGHCKGRGTIVGAPNRAWRGEGRRAGRRSVSGSDSVESESNQQPHYARD